MTSYKLGKRGMGCWLSSPPSWLLSSFGGVKEADVRTLKQDYFSLSSAAVIKHMVNAVTVGYLKVGD